jgi:hypothetical protein
MFDSSERTAVRRVVMLCALLLGLVVPTAHLYLGIVLSVQRKLDEGQRELALKSNSPEVTLAHRYIGGVLYERREYSRAADELETYLRLVPKAPIGRRCSKSFASGGIKNKILSTRKYKLCVLLRTRSD